jgi:sugar phosphate isomerase/epimerase
MTLDRREFLTVTAGSAGLLVLPDSLLSAAGRTCIPPVFRISLAQWSLHRALMSGKMDNLEFPAAAKNDYGIDAVEYVNSFFKKKAEDTKYLAQLKKRCGDVGVRSLLIMVDGEGQIGHADKKKRKQAVDNHKKWVTAARALGCHSIRVNARSSGTYEEQRDRAADGLHQLASFAKPHKIGVLVENHGGLSSSGIWLSAVMRKVSLPNCGTLPDFGNFRISRKEKYDRYKGVRELMPFAKAVSAKSYAFDAKGNETTIDYARMMKIVVDSGYRGYVGIEYEGSGLSEPAGIKATKKLLENVRSGLVKRPR